MVRVVAQKAEAVELADQLVSGDHLTEAADACPARNRQGAAACDAAARAVARVLRPHQSRSRLPRAQPRWRVGRAGPDCVTNGIRWI
jgi:hypothetical protein